MRLTLRSLLALLDDPGLDQEVREGLSSELNSDQRFSQIADRIAQLSSKPRMAAPQIDAMGTSDANRVSQYLDVSLPPEHLARFEQGSLKSDSLLAEVAACHQIICRMYPNALEVSPKLRDRIYQIPFEGAAPNASASPSLSVYRENEEAIQPPVSDENPASEAKSDQPETQTKVKTPTSNLVPQPAAEPQLSVRPEVDQVTDSKSPQRDISSSKKSSPKKTVADDSFNESEGSRARWMVVLAILGLWFGVWFCFPQIQKEVWHAGENKEEVETDGQGTGDLPKKSDLNQSLPSVAKSKQDGDLPNSLPVAANAGLPKTGLPTTSVQDDTNQGSLGGQQNGLPSTDSIQKSPLKSDTAVVQNGGQLSGSDNKDVLEPIQSSEEKGLVPSLPSTVSPTNQTNSLPPAVMAAKPGQKEKNGKETIGNPLPTTPLPSLANNTLPPAGKTADLSNQDNLANQNSGTVLPLPPVTGSSSGSGVKPVGLNEVSGAGSPGVKPAVASQPFGGTGNAVSSLPSTSAVKTPFLRTNWSKNTCVITADSEGARRHQVLPSGISVMEIQSKNGGSWKMTFGGGARYVVRSKEGWRDVKPESSVALRQGQVFIQSTTKGETLRISTPIGPISLTSDADQSEVILEVMPTSPIGVHAEQASCRYLVGCFGVSGKFVVHNRQIEEKFVGKNVFLEVAPDGMVQKTNKESDQGIMEIVDGLRRGEVHPEIEKMSSLIEKENPSAELVGYLRNNQFPADRKYLKEVSALWAYELNELDPVFEILSDLTLAKSWHHHIERVRIRLITDKDAIKKLRHAIVGRRIPMWVEKTFYGFQPTKLESKDWAEVIEGLHHQSQAVRTLAILTLTHLTGENFGYDPRQSVAENRNAIITWRDWFKEKKFSQFTSQARGTGQLRPVN